MKISFLGRQLWEYFRKTAFTTLNVSIRQRVLPLVGFPVSSTGRLCACKPEREMANGVDLDMRDGSGGTLYDVLGRPTAWKHSDTACGYARD